MEDCGNAQRYQRLTSSYVPLVEMLGIHFQIRDDYINLVSNDYHDAKGFAEDLTEGKFSFPMVHCIQNFPSKRSILESILRQKTSDVEVKKYAISILRECGSLEFTRSYLMQIERESREMIQRLGGNSMLESILDKLAIAYV